MLRTTLTKQVNKIKQLDKSLQNQGHHKIEISYREFKDSKQKIISDRIALAKKFFNEVIKFITGEDSENKTLNDSKIKTLFCLKDTIKKMAIAGEDPFSIKGKYIKNEKYCPEPLKDLIRNSDFIDPYVWNLTLINYLSKQVEDCVDSLYFRYTLCLNSSFFSLGDAINEIHYTMIVGKFVTNEVFAYLKSKITHTKCKDVQFEMIPHCKEGVIDTDKWDIQTKQLMLLSGATEFKSELEKEGFNVILKNKKNHAKIIIEDVLNNDILGPKIKISDEAIIKAVTNLKIIDKKQEPIKTKNQENKSTQDDSKSAPSDNYAMLFKDLKIDYFMHDLSWRYFPYSQKLPIIMLYLQNENEIIKLKKQGGALYDEWLELSSSLMNHHKFYPNAEEYKDNILVNAVYSISAKKSGMYFSRDTAINIAINLLAAGKFPVEIFHIQADKAKTYMFEDYIVVQGRSKTSIFETKQTLKLKQWRYEATKWGDDIHIYHGSIQVGCNAKDYCFHPTVKAFCEEKGFSSNKTSITRTSVYATIDDLKLHHSYVNTLSKAIDKEFLEKKSLFQPTVKALIEKQKIFKTYFRLFNDKMNREVECFKESQPNPSVDNVCSVLPSLTQPSKAKS